MMDQNDIDRVTSSDYMGNNPREYPQATIPCWEKAPNH